MEKSEYDGFDISFKEVYKAEIEKWKPSYKIIKQLGSGGFGSVYMLEKKHDKGISYAVKVICSGDEKRDEQIASEIRIQKFYRDVPGIVNIYDYDTKRITIPIKLLNNDSEIIDINRKLHMIQLEFMDGSVDDMLKKQGKLDAKEAVSIIIDVCKALEAMEKHGGDRNDSGVRCIHGDIKPSNILYKQSSYENATIYKLSDFGCSYNTNTTYSDSKYASTPKYALTNEWEPQRDEYALGITLMEMLGAPCPSEADKTNDSLWFDLPEACSVPDKLLKICRKASALKPSDRYQTAEEMKKALETWLKEEQEEERFRIDTLEKIRTLEAELESTESVDIEKAKLDQLRQLISKLLKNTSAREREELSNILAKCDTSERNIKKLEKYQSACKLAEEGSLISYLQTIEILSGIPEYKDSLARISEISKAAITKYRIQKDKEIEQIKKNYEEEILKLISKHQSELNKMKDLIRFQKKEDSVKNVDFTKKKSYYPGEIVLFGHYPQTSAGNDTTSIRWKVLDVIGDSVLLISELGLDMQTFHKNYIGTTWKDSSLNKWLNEEFLKKAFNYEEFMQIIKANNDNKDNPEYGTKGTSNTEDWIFILSIDEAKQYFKTDADRICQATEYAKKNGAYEEENTGNTWWWLRSSGCNRKFAAIVHSDGRVSNHGAKIDYVQRSARANGKKMSGAIRPALWLRI